MKTQDYNCAAALDLDSLDVAVRRNARSPIDGRSEFNMQKPFRQESACLTVQQSAFFSGFFTSIAAASAALHRSLKSAGCTVKIGWYPPRYSKPRSVGERLHNSIEPKRQNGQSWIISTRPAHLVWKQMEQVVKSLVVLLPL